MSSIPPIFITNNLYTVIQSMGGEKTVKVFTTNKSVIRSRSVNFYIINLHSKVIKWLFNFLIILGNLNVTAKGRSQDS